MTLRYDVSAAPVRCAPRPAARKAHHVTRLIVLPDDTAKPLIDALDGARDSVNIRMFLFTDPSMVDGGEGGRERAASRCA